jgi:N-formylglutamate amidohydrolase
MTEAIHLPPTPRTALVFNNARAGSLLAGIPATGAPVLEDRINAPREAIKNLLNEATALHGQTLLLDVVTGPRTEADITLNDLNGFSCSPVITQTAATLARVHGLSVAFNNPSSNPALIRTMMDQDLLHHTLQIKIADDLPAGQKSADVRTMLNALSVKLSKLMVA